MVTAEEQKAAEEFNRAVEAGNPEALLSAARVYLDVDGDFYDLKRGVQFLLRAADCGSAQAMIALGDLALTDTDISFWQQAAMLKSLPIPCKKPKRKIVKQHKKQMEWYTAAAKLGDTDAMSVLGMAYHLGYPENRDDERAFLWASRAADVGNVEAMYQTAYFYENGFGTEKDIGAAMLLYTQAAEQGVCSAAVRLYEIYTNGFLGVQPDGKKAAHYLFLSGEPDTEDECGEAED